MERCLERDLELPLQGLRRELHERRVDGRDPGLRHTSRVHEHVEWADRRLRGLDERQRLLAISEVGGVCEHGRALAPQLLGAGLDPICGGGDRDARAEPRQQPRTGKADPVTAAAAADERCAAGEAEQ